MMADVAFKGEIPAAALEGYPSGYALQLLRVEEILEPFKLEDAEGRILYDRSAITHVPEGTWAERPPTAEELWNAQEDLWLTQALFESIAALNKGADKLTDSSIRQLLLLHLRGGIRDYSSGACALGAGFLFSSPGLLTALCLVWGFAVVADSAQFSAAVSELTDHRYVGTALTVQTCLGFLLTLLTIRLVAAIVETVGWTFAFAFLALGPVFGIWSMLRLRRLPEASRMASGNR
jgi:hypothetical protein